MPMLLHQRYSVHVFFERDDSEDLFELVQVREAWIVLDMTVASTDTYELTHRITGQGDDDLVVLEQTLIAGPEDSETLQEELDMIDGESRVDLEYALVLRHPVEELDFVEPVDLEEPVEHEFETGIFESLTSILTDLGSAARDLLFPGN